MPGIVVGLAAEAMLAHGLGCAVATGGGGVAGAVSAAESLVDAGADGLVSFGLAGGLSLVLSAGAVVLPLGVVDDAGHRWLTDVSLSARLGEAAGWLLAASAIIATREAKQMAWQSSAALAVDMESGAVAQVAARHGLPFAVLRAVCDPAHRTLPPAAMTALDAQGRIRPAALLRSLIRFPGQLPALVALGREANQARQALLARVSTIGRLD